MINGGGFLLYLQMHENPTDLRAVLRDYGEDMMLPALEMFTERPDDRLDHVRRVPGQHEKGIPFTSREGDEMTTQQRPCSGLTPASDRNWRSKSGDCRNHSAGPRHSTAST